MLTFTFYSDPGHGWLKVDLSLVVSLGSTISNFSYIKGNSAYLEEDSDMCNFLLDLNNAGIAYRIVNRYSNRSSRIRNYYPYRSYLNI